VRARRGGATGSGRGAGAGGGSTAGTSGKVGDATSAEGMGAAVITAVFSTMGNGTTLEVAPARASRAARIFAVSASGSGGT
jgi:hypothetical protein